MAGQPSPYFKYEVRRKKYGTTPRMRVSLITSHLVLAVSLGLAVPAGQLLAQRPAQDHPGQYGAQDIEAGSRLYAGQCTLCHGPNGDLVLGADLRRGLFRRSVSDED